MQMCIVKHNEKGDPIELNFEGLENIPTDRSQRVDKKNGVNCPVIMFISGVTAITMSKVAHFLYFLLMAAKRQSEFGQNIYMHLKDLIEFFQKIIWSSAENTRNKPFFCILMTLTLGVNMISRQMTPFLSCTF